MPISEAILAPSARWKDITQALTRLVSSRARLEWVREAAFHYNDMLNSLAHRHLVLQHSLKATFLVDFDVIFEYLSVHGAATNRSLAADVFFQTGSALYAIPLGA